jgi:hypothetical protein
MTRRESALARARLFKAGATPLCRLALKHAADKCPTFYHSYSPVYHRLLGPVRRQCRAVLEIGIGHPELMDPIVEWTGRKYRPGASLRMWRDYFPKARIIGCDIRNDVLFNERRISTFVADQGSVRSLRALLRAAKVRSFDLILDDGSHQVDDMRVSLRTLWPHVRQGGTYIIEDIHTDGLGPLKKSREVQAVLREALVFEHNAALHDWDHFLAFRKI